MPEENLRFGLTQKAYDHMCKVAADEFISYEDCFLADRLWRIEKSPYLYLHMVRRGPPSLMREYNMLFKEGYVNLYTDKFADFMEAQFKSNSPTLVPTMPAFEITEAGRKKMEEMESNPTMPPDPWGAWLHEAERDEFEVPPWITRGLVKLGWGRIVSKPIDMFQGDEE